MLVGWVTGGARDTEKRVPSRQKPSRRIDGDIDRVETKSTASQRVGRLTNGIQSGVKACVAALHCRCLHLGIVVVRQSQHISIWGKSRLVRIHVRANKAANPCSPDKSGKSENLTRRSRDCRLSIARLLRMRKVCRPVKRGVGSGAVGRIEQLASSNSQPTLRSACLCRGCECQPS